MKQSVKSAAELRRFGLVMAAPLSLLAAVLWWRERPAWPYLAGAAAFFAIMALVAPAGLRLLERLWMKFAEVLGTVMTHVVLVLTFFLVFTPVGLIMRLMGRSPLALEFDAKRASYWDAVEQGSPYTRSERPY